MDTTKIRLRHLHQPNAAECVEWAAGWPTVLSSLKTLLETGNPLQMTTKRWSGADG